MRDKYRNDKELEIIITEFEKKLEIQSVGFLSLETFEKIIDYYLSTNTQDLALKACNIGIEQHPFSTELKLDKAQILSNIGEYEESIHILDEASVLQPNDLEILMMRGSIYSLIGNEELKSEAAKSAFEYYNRLMSEWPNWRPNTMCRLF